MRYIRVSDPVGVIPDPILGKTTRIPHNEIPLNIARKVFTGILNQGVQTGSGSATLVLNPLMHGRFRPIIESAVRVSKTDFLDLFFKWTSATKFFERSIIFRYGLPKDMLSKGLKTTTGVQCPPPPNASFKCFLYSSG